MSRKRALEPSPATLQQRERALDSPYLTSDEAVVYLRLPSRRSLYNHIRENALPVLRAGGDFRFDRRELDAWLRGSSALELVRKRA